ncbi:MAG: hypothetical protein AB7U82_17850 [Blastocatellales bacterium]
MKKFLCNAFLLVSLWACPSYAQTASGRVVDIISGNGIPEVGIGASVVCTSGRMQFVMPLGGAQTDADGKFSLTYSITDPRCSASFVNFTASKPGYVFYGTLVGSGSDLLFRGTDRPFISNSAASYSILGFTSEMIVAGFGQDLAASTESASTNLPTTLAGRSVVVKDNQGNEKTAQLFYVSPTQINYLMPVGLAEGSITVKLIANNQTIRAGLAYITKVSPGVFAANANGQGVAAAVVSRVKADGSQQYEPVARFDTTQNKYVAIPIDLGSETDQVILSLFGTGWRSRSSLQAVSVKIGGTDAQVQYAGMQPTLSGLDQINALIPRSLIGRGEVDVEIIVDGKSANTVKISVK